MKSDLSIQTTPKKVVYAQIVLFFIQHFLTLILLLTYFLPIYNYQNENYFYFSFMIKYIKEDGFFFILLLLFAIFLISLISFIRRTRFVIKDINAYKCFIKRQMDDDDIFAFITYNLDISRNNNHDFIIIFLCFCLLNIDYELIPLIAIGKPLFILFAISFLFLFCQPLKRIFAPKKIIDARFILIDITKLIISVVTFYLFFIFTKYLNINFFDEKLTSLRMISFENNNESLFYMKNFIFVPCDKVFTENKDFLVFITTYKITLSVVLYKFLKILIDSSNRYKLFTNVKNDKVIKIRTLFIGDMFNKKIQIFDGIGYLIIGVLNLIVYLKFTSLQFNLILPIVLILVGFISIIISVNFKNQLAIKSLKEKNERELENTEVIDPYED